MAALGLLALFGGIEVLALLIVIALAAEQMPALTAVRRYALALLALFGANAFVLTVFAVIGLSWQPRLLVACYLIAGVMAPGGVWRRTGRGRYANASDTWAFTAAAITFVLFYKPLVSASTGRAMAMLSYATDSSAHLYLVQDIRQYGGYINLRVPVDGWSGMAEYPAAWAGNVALLLQLLLGDEQEIAPLIRIVTPLIIASYALLVFFAIAVALDVVQAMTERVSFRSGLVACACVGLTTIVGVNVFLLAGGFYTQSLATAAILAAVSLFSEASSSSRRHLLLLCLLTVAIMQTWYLLAPVHAAVLLVYIGTVQPPKRRLLVALVPTCLLSAYPVLTGPQGSSQINAVGGSPLPTIGGIVSLLLVALLGLLYFVAARGGGRQLRLALVSALVATLLLTVAVLLLQSITGAGVNYYAFKLFYSVFLIGTVAGAAAASIAVNQLALTRRSWSSALLILVIVSGLGIGSYTTRDLSWPYAQGKTPRWNDGQALDAIFRAHPSGVPKGTDAWVLDGCDRVADHISSKWAYDLSLTWDTSLSLTYLEFAFGYENPADISMIKNRARDPSVKTMEIYAHNNCEPDALRDMGYLPGVKVIRVD